MNPEISIKRPLAEMTFTPAEFRESFPLIDTAFSWYKAAILYAESYLCVDILQPENNGMTLLTVYTKCDENVERSLDAHLRTHNMGNIDGHKLLVDEHENEINAVRWIVLVGGCKNE